MVTNSSHCFPYLISVHLWPDMSSYATQIVGDVYDISDTGIDCTDKLEGHPRFYVRTPILVQNDAGEIYSVEAYLLSESYALSLIKTHLTGTHLTFLTGDWTSFPGRMKYD